MRPYPFTALFALGAAAQRDPGFVPFCRAMAKEGFALQYEEDELLSEEEWKKIATSRVDTLWWAYQKSLERQPGMGKIPEREGGHLIWLRSDGSRH